METAPMASATQTQTQVVSITRTKMGIAVAFLGFAAVAAAAAGVAGKNCVSNKVTVIDNGAVRVCEQETLVTKSSGYGLTMSRYTNTSARVLVNNPEQWYVSDPIGGGVPQSPSSIVIPKGATKVFSLVDGAMYVSLTYNGMYKNYATFSVEVNMGGGASEAGILNLSMRSIDEDFNKDRILLAGNGTWVGKLGVEAKFEDINIKDLKFINSNVQAVDSVKDVCLYKAKILNSESLVACAPMNESGIVSFENLGYVSNQGTQFLYIYVTSNNMDDTQMGISDTHDIIELAIEALDFNVVASGIQSGKILTFGGANGMPPQAGQYAFDYDLDGVFNENEETKTAHTPKFIVSGSRIGNVNLVNNYGGEVVNSILAGTGQYTVAILGVTNEAHNNTDENGNSLKLGIDSVRFDVEKSYGLKISDVTLQRIGGVQLPIHMNLSGINDLSQTKGTAVAYDMVYNYNLGTYGKNDAEVNSGETTYFMVKAIVDKLSTSTENFLSFNMDDVNGTYNYDIDNNIDWLADSMNSSTLFNALLLDVNSLKGTKLSQ